MNSQPELKRIKLADIVPSASNPRKNFKTPDWPEFVENIRTHGVIQPGVCRVVKENGGTSKTRVELVCGERRYRASLEAKLPDMPLMVHDLTDAQVVELQQIENLQREDLSALEEAQGYADWRDSLIASKAVKTVEEAVAHICGKINRKRSAVFQKLALLKTSAQVQDAIKNGQLDVSQAALIAQIPGTVEQTAALKKAQQQEMSVRDLQEYIESEYRISLKNAPFDTKLTYGDSKHLLNPCTDCPHRTGNMALENVNPDVCTKPDCFRDKCTEAAKNSQEKIAGVLSESTWKKVQYGNEYISIDDTCYDDGARRSWKTVLGKFAPPIYLTVANHYAHGLALRRLYKASDAAKAAKENKLLKAAAKSKPSAAQLRDEKRRAAENEKRKRKDEALKVGLNEAVHVASSQYQTGKLLPFTFWKALAKSIVLANQYDLADEIFTGRGMRLPGCKDKDIDDVELLFSYIEKQNTAENLIGLMVHICGTGLTDYRDDGGDANKYLLLWGIDWQKSKTPKDKTATKKQLKIHADAKARWAKVKAAVKPKTKVKGAKK